MSRRLARATQADIRRAIAAAKQEDWPSAVRILPDGTIEITPIPAQDSRTVPGAAKREVML